MGDLPLLEMDRLNAATSLHGNNKTGAHSRLDASDHFRCHMCRVVTCLGREPSAGLVKTPKSLNGYMDRRMGKTDCLKRDTSLALRRPKFAPSCSQGTAGVCLRCPQLRTPKVLSLNTGQTYDIHFLLRPSVYTRIGVNKNPHH